MLEEDFEKVVNTAIERILLKMPEVIGNLIMDQSNAIKLNKKFYGENPEFKNNLPLVIATLEKLESDNPGLDYGKLLDKAIPIIKENLKSITLCPTNNLSKKESLNLELPDLSNGEF